MNISFMSFVKAHNYESITQSGIHMNDRLSLFTCERAGKEQPGSVMLITRFYSDKSLNVCICLTTDN